MNVLIKLEGKITPKARPRIYSRGGKTHGVTPQKTKDFEAYVELMTKARLKRPIDGAVAVDIMITKKPPKSWTKGKKRRAKIGKVLATAKPDLDNYAKAILDGMNGIAYLDDSYIIDLRVRKEYGKNPGALIKIKSVDGKPAY